MTEPVPPEGWAQLHALLRARHLAAAPEPEPHHCDLCREVDAQLAAVVGGLEEVVTKRSTPALSQPPPDSAGERG